MHFQILVGFCVSFLYSVFIYESLSHHGICRREVFPPSTPNPSVFLFVFSDPTGREVQGDDSHCCHTAVQCVCVTAKGIGEACVHHQHLWEPFHFLDDIQLLLFSQLLWLLGVPSVPLWGPCKRTEMWGGLRGSSAGLLRGAAVFSRHHSADVFCGGRFRMLAELKIDFKNACAVLVFKLDLKVAGYEMLKGERRLYQKIPSGGRAVIFYLFFIG